MAAEFEREARRVLRRLLAPGAYAARVEGGEVFGLFTARGGSRALMRIEAGLLSALLRRDLIAPDEERAGAFRVSEAGAAWQRRMAAKSDSFRAQHQLRAARGESGFRNLSESPLQWLRRRKGPDGRALLSRRQFEAGERLRSDFTRAGLSGRLTADWSQPVGRRRGSGFSGFSASEAALAARERFRAALMVLGGGLSDIAVDLCCELRGLEEAERRLGWPRRSGKVVLALALDRLADHYGIGGVGGGRD